MFQCKDLLTLPSLSNVKLICGNNGVNNIIRWAYKAESLDLSKWVKGGELLIVSGAVIEKNNFNLSKLMTSAIDLNLSGTLLLVGDNYIKSIPKSLIKLCNEKNFPVFAIHWSTPLVNIFEELGHAIVTSSVSKYNDDFLASIVFGKEYSEEELLLKGTNLNYDLQSPQKVFVIHFYDEYNSNLNKINLNEFEINEFINSIRDLFNHNNLNILISSYGNNIIGLFPATLPLSTLNIIFKEFIDEVNNLIPKLYLNIGMGKTYSSPSFIQKSFQEASKCMSIASKLNKHNDILHYDNLGILSLFFDLDRNDLLKEFSNQMLSPLINNKDDLLCTLQTYLNCNCNINKTAETLSTHRNTIKYRLKKIESLTDNSLTDPLYKLNIENALLIYKFLL